ncbi:MAG: hypothetical protein M1816_000981 [Peltula sp. TS41687]|nr:MAG: hypothetical protein M1816_000981 [Peltula sp. TS41687]
MRPPTILSHTLLSIWVFVAVVAAVPIETTRRFEDMSNAERKVFYPEKWARMERQNYSSHYFRKTPNEIREELDQNVENMFDCLEQIVTEVDLDAGDLGPTFEAEL